MLRETVMVSNDCLSQLVLLTSKVFMELSVMGTETKAQGTLTKDNRQLDFKILVLNKLTQPHF